MQDILIKQHASYRITSMAYYQHPESEKWFLSIVYFGQVAAIEVTEKDVKELFEIGIREIFL